MLPGGFPFHQFNILVFEVNTRTYPNLFAVVLMFLSYCFYRCKLWLRMPFAIQTQYMHKTYAINMNAFTVICSFPHLLRKWWVTADWRSMYCICSPYEEHPWKVHYEFVTNNACMLHPICEQLENEFRTLQIHPKVSNGTFWFSLWSCRWVA